MNSSVDELKSQAWPCYRQTVPNDCSREWQCCRDHNSFCLLCFSFQSIVIWDDIGWQLQKPECVCHCQVWRG